MQDLDSQQSESENEDFIKSEMSDENSNELNESSSEEAQLQTFLKLKEHGQSSRTKALRLKENDVIVAIDGSSYHESIDKLVDLMSSGEEDDMWLLTVWRNGKFFEIFTRGPLGGIFEFTRPEESQMIMELFQKREMGQKEEYRIFEALRDVKRVVDVYDTTHTQLCSYLTSSMVGTTENGAIASDTLCLSYHLQRKYISFYISSRFSRPLFKK